jgi:hypothetical protein
MARWNYKSFSISLRKENSRGPGEQLSLAPPPGRATGAPQAPHKITGSSDTRYKQKNK